MKPKYLLSAGTSGGSRDGGGKYAGLDRLWQVRRVRSNGEPDWDIPEFVGLSTQFCGDLVLPDPSLKEFVSGFHDELDRTLTNGQRQNWKLLRELAAEVRAAVESMEFSPVAQEVIADAYRAVGSDTVAVRSSADIEDGIQHSGAGMGETVLDAAGLASVTAAVKKVQASLFSDAFLMHRLYHRGARMGVVIQNMVDVGCAGSLDSRDPVTGRPALVIEIGQREQVVEGDSLPSRWVVGPDARYVLEHDGGSADRTGHVSEEQVLAAARVGCAIQRRFQQEGWAEDVNVEFAFAKSGELFILQARPAVNTGPSCLAIDEPVSKEVLLWH